MGLMVRFHSSVLSIARVTVLVCHGLLCIDAREASVGAGVWKPDVAVGNYPVREGARNDALAIVPFIQTVRLA